jgi:hypothetical protein
LDHYRDCVEATRRPSLGELYGDPSGGRVRELRTDKAAEEQAACSTDMSLCCPTSLPTHPNVVPRHRGRRVLLCHPVH